MKNSVKEAALFERALSAANQNLGQFRTSPWLTSHFDCHVWELNFTGVSTILDFERVLEDGSLLTASKNRELLTVFKFFIIAQTHPAFHKGTDYSSHAAHLRTNTAIHVLERILLLSRHLRLGAFGIHSLIAADGYSIMERLVTYDTDEAIYEWVSRAREFLLPKIRDVLDSDRQAAKHQIPDIEYECHTNALGFSQKDCVTIRVWLWKHDFLRRQNGKILFDLNVTKLSEALYPGGTLRRTWNRSSFPELSKLTSEIGTEFPRAPVRTEGVGVSVARLRNYVSAIRLLGKLGAIGIYSPKAFLSAFDDREFALQLRLRSGGRFATLPIEVVMTSLRNAIEFSVDLGARLLDSFGNVVAAARGSGKSVATLFRYGRESIESQLDPELKRLGIKVWRLNTVRCHREMIKDEESLAKAYFRRLRQNEGLYELLQVLQGAALVVTGALAARRQGELIDLIANSFLDRSKTRLVFEIGKSGTAGYRQTTSRPIPPILVEILLNFSRLQDRLIAGNWLGEPMSLFAKFLPVGCSGLGQPKEIDLNDSLDVFCDYFETLIDKNGRRFYIRQHQLRRFFAMMFFWGNSFDGLDTLRWFLGHVDVEHLYHYITESISGEALRQVKVDFLMDRSRKGDDATRPVLNLISQRYGVSRYRILDIDELGPYIDFLIETGDVTVEPEFFNGPDGKSYRIVVKIAKNLDVRS